MEVEAAAAAGEGRELNGKERNEGGGVAASARAWPTSSKRHRKGQGGACWYVHGPRGVATALASKHHTHIHTHTHILIHTHTHTHTRNTKTYINTHCMQAHTSLAMAVWASRAAARSCRALATSAVRVEMCARIAPAWSSKLR